MTEGSGVDADLLPPAGGHVALVLLTGIGDVVHGLPLANALKSHRPDLELTWIAEPAPAQVLEHHPAVARRVVFRKSDGLRGVAALYGDLRKLRPFDLTINAQRYFKSIFPTLFTGAPIRVGLARDKTRDGVSFFNTHHLPSGPWKHTQDIFLDFLPVLGLPRPDTPTWNITFSTEEDEAARRFFETLPKGPRVGIVVGTANPAKDWPTRRYPPLVDALAEELGYSVVLLGGPDPRERAVAHRVHREARSKPVDALADTVRELMWKIRGLDLLVSPDTGPLHIARALEIPVVGLYGHSNPWRVGPYRAYEELVVDRYTDPGEPPDPSRYEPRSQRMELITVEDVLERVMIARERYAVA
ncbi:MAG: glycosyltransferase family 9 protein [Longimicrobiales bacterium]|nr:glycosyltransferase family 9 protein [Longimicrobiales bacterium]